MEIKSGQTWKHYKGGVYRIVTLAQNNETDELYDMVVYQDVSAPEKVWTQPLARFEEELKVDGEVVPRFTLVNEN